MPNQSLQLQPYSHKSADSSKRDPGSSEEEEMEVLSTKTRRSTRKSAVAAVSISF